MNERIEKRVRGSVDYMIKNKATIQATAEKFGVSQSTTHFDVRHRIGRLDPRLQKKVGKVIDENIIQGKVRGGIATKIKRESNLKVVPEGEAKKVINESPKLSNEKTAEGNQSLKIIGTSIIAAGATALIVNRKNKRNRSFIWK